MARSTTFPEFGGSLKTQLTSGIVIVVDNCIYSRKAIKIMLAEIYSNIVIYAFECFTDYKLWCLTFGHISKEKSFIINLSSSLLYDGDVIDFLCLEKELTSIHANSAAGQSSDNILLFTQKNRRISQYHGRSDSRTWLTVVDNVRELSHQALHMILREFINLKARTRAEIKPKKTEPIGHQKLTEGEIRAIKIIMSGKSISYWAPVYGVAPKTLYSQRSNMFSRLGLENRNDGVVYLSMHPELYLENN